MKKTLTILLLGLFFISFASAILPHEQNTDLKFSFSDTLAVDCNVSTLDTPTSTIWINQVMTKTGNTFNATILEGNFTETGTHCANIECISGYGNVCREVTKTGSAFTIAEAVLYSFTLLLLAAFLYFAINGVKKAVSVEWLIGYICLSYIILYLILSVLWILSENYLYAFQMLGRVLFIAWFTMGIGFLPFVVAVSLYLLGKDAKAALEQNYIKQGYTRDEAKELSRKNKR